VIGAGTLDILPHDGAVAVTPLAVCGSTHRESYFDIVMVGICGGGAGAGGGDCAEGGVGVVLEGGGCPSPDAPTAVQKSIEYRELRAPADLLVEKIVEHMEIELCLAFSRRQMLPYVIEHAAHVCEVDVRVD